VKANFTSSGGHHPQQLPQSRLQRIFGVPVFANVSSANDLADFFASGSFP